MQPYTWKMQCVCSHDCHKEVSAHIPGLCLCNESGREIKMTQDDNFIQSLQWPLAPMQIRKHTVSCGLLPHTSKLSLEQVVCQEPFVKSRTEKGMGIPVQPGAIAFSNSLSWARCQQHRIPLASAWQSSIVLCKQLCCSLFPSRGTAQTGHGHLLHNSSFTRTHNGLKVCC